MSNTQFQPQFQPPKRHTGRTVLIVVASVIVGMIAVIGGCTAVVGGALSSVDTTTPVEVATPLDNGPTPDPVVTPTNQSSTSSKPVASPSPKVTSKPAPKLTLSQEQAIGAAQSYLEVSAFSRKGLIKQLTSEYGEGFSSKDATFAVDHLKVDWNAQAAKAAEQYLEVSHFSRSGLIKQLESPYGGQFTHSQAVYGVTKAGL